MSERAPITRAALLDYFLEAARPKAEWAVGMEVERMVRHAGDGKPLDYDGHAASIRGVLEAYRDRRECVPILEGAHLIGLDGAFGTITLEPGGQVEWSSRPRRSLGVLSRELGDHIELCDVIAAELPIRWLEPAVDPETPVDAMPWMPKARYKIMRPFLGARGRLAHRMMTQTASIQVAFDYADPADWKRKFLAGATLAPLATALFANSSRVDGADSGQRSFRQAIWRETDPNRCNLPPALFQPDFGIEAWLDWVLGVPTIFRHRARGLVPAGGVAFSKLLALTGCDAVHLEDWEIHVSTIFTEVRSYTYIEVRSADLQPPALMFAVPAFWTGLLYNDAALDAALALSQPFADHEAWSLAIRSAARDGLDGGTDAGSWRDLARRAVDLAATGLEAEAAEFGDVDPALAALERLRLTRRL